MSAISCSAQDILTAAARDIGALGVAELYSSLPTAQQTDGLNRLNTLVSSWSIQSLTIPAIARQVFPLVADQSTYTIGPTGSLRTSRPPSLTGAALLLNPTISSYAVTGVSTSSRTFTVAGNHTSTLVSGSEFVISGSMGNDGSYTIVSSAFSVSTTVTVAEQVLDSTADGTLTVIFQSSSTVEIPYSVITDDQYEFNQVKQLSNSQFTTVYYNQSYAGGLGLIVLWPVPNTASNALVLYRLEQMVSFPALSTTMSIPEGAFEALEYNVAVRMATPWGRDIQRIPLVAKMADDTLAVYKRQNTKWNDLPNEAAWAVRGSRRYGYNIQTDNFQGGAY